MFAGRLFSAFTIPLFGLILVYLFGVTRWVISPNGFMWMLISLAVLHLASHLIGAFLAFRVNNKAPISRVFVLIIFNIGITLTCHFYKEELFGFSFYHIPSISMSPTLIPGDVILIDTWVYQKQNMVSGDIIVFQHPNRNVIMVKRIKNLRGEEEKAIFVIGDNKKSSIDSRRFGWIPGDNVLGKATFIWFNTQRCKHSLLECKAKTL